MRESGVVDRLTNMAQNELINIITFFLGTCVGMTMAVDAFLRVGNAENSHPRYCCVRFLHGGRGVVRKADVQDDGRESKSADRLRRCFCRPDGGAVSSHNVGQEYNPQNYLLMHAMGPNVARVVGTAIAAGILLAILGK